MVTLRVGYLKMTLNLIGPSVATPLVSATTGQNPKILSRSPLFPSPPHPNSFYPSYLPSNLFTMSAEEVRSFLSRDFSV